MTVDNEDKSHRAGRLWGRVCPSPSLGPRPGLWGRGGRRSLEPSLGRC
jgi:hypothetical protein